MKSTDIKEVKWNGGEVVALYMGHNLIYSKQNEPTNVLAGSFSEPNDSGYTIIINNTEYTIFPKEDGTFSVVPELQPFTYCYMMFYNQAKLVSITSFPDTSEVASMSCMFQNCSSLSSLDVSHFNTEKVTSMSQMFQNCSSLSSLDVSHFNTDNVTNMWYMFNHCESLTSLDLSSFNTEKVKNMYGTFSWCTSLEYLWVDFDLSAVQSYQLMFLMCSKLTNVSGSFSNIKVDIDLGHSPLTNASAMVFINGLSDVASTKTIKFKSTTYNTLTDEQIALATSRGWSVVSG